MDGRRVVTTTTNYLPGYFLEYTLGAINASRLPGTVALLKTDSSQYMVRDGPDGPGGGTTLGYLELAGLPLLDDVHLARVRSNGQIVLVAGDDDPLLPSVDLLEFLGRVEPHPIRPRRQPYSDSGAQVPQALLELDRLLASRQEEIDALWSRVNGIHNSLPGRVYQRLQKIPGLKKALLGRLDSSP
jgi:hypothetical protein